MLSSDKIDVVRTRDREGLRDYTRPIVRSLLSRLQRRGRAVAAVEFALLAPVFLITFGGVVELGAAIYVQIRLETALAAATNYVQLPTNIAMVNSTKGATLALNIVNLVGEAFNNGTGENPFYGNPTVTAVVNNGPSNTITTNGTSASGTASNADLYYCPIGSTPSWTWGVSVAQGTTCADGGAAGKFVSITASYYYGTFFPYGFVKNGTMTLGAIVQVQ